jgi:hypothetical protein
MNHQTKPDSRRGRGSSMDAKRMTRQRREGEANRPRRAKTGQCKLRKPSWTEFVRLADQAVVAIAGADMINRAEPRACGYSRRSRRLDTKWPETGERQLRCQTKPRKVSEGRRRTRLASSHTGENPPYGMNRGGGGNEVDGLMTFCHDARKGRNIGSHWPNHVRASAPLDLFPFGCGSAALRLLRLFAAKLAPPKLWLKAAAHVF